MTALANPGIVSALTVVANLSPLRSPTGSRRSNCDKWFATVTCAKNARNSKQKISSTYRSFFLEECFPQCWRNLGTLLYLSISTLVHVPPKPCLEKSFSLCNKALDQDKCLNLHCQCRRYLVTSKFRNIWDLCWYRVAYREVGKKTKMSCFPVHQSVKNLIGNLWKEAEHLWLFHRILDFYS